MSQFSDAVSAVSTLSVRSSPSQILCCTHPCLVKLPSLRSSLLLKELGYALVGSGHKATPCGVLHSHLTSTDISGCKVQIYLRKERTGLVSSRRCWLMPEEHGASLNWCCKTFSNKVPKRPQDFPLNEKQTLHRVPSQPRFGKSR